MLVMRAYIKADAHLNLCSFKHVLNNVLYDRIMVADVQSLLGTQKNIWKRAKNNFLVS